MLSLIRRVKARIDGGRHILSASEWYHRMSAMEESILASSEEHCMKTYYAAQD